MPSPFPGMNPYLEQEDSWHDFHISFVVSASHVLVASVRPKYLVRIDNYVFEHEPRHSERHRFLEVRICETGELVTVIEMLSPSNKAPGRFRDQYLTRRLGLLTSNVHFVEIDFLRGGPKMWKDKVPGDDYSVLVSRA